MKNFPASIFTVIALVWCSSSFAQTASFDATTNTLTLPSVVVSGATYKNVVVRLDKFSVISAELPYIPSITTTLRLEIMDITSAANGMPPLRDVPYIGFSFNFDGSPVTITSNGIDSAQTYSELLDAIRIELALNPKLSNFTASLGSSFTTYDDTGKLLTGTAIEISGNGVIDGSSVRLLAGGLIPPYSSISAKWSVTSFAE